MPRATAESRREKEGERDRRWFSLANKSAIKLTVYNSYYAVRKFLPYSFGIEAQR
jgi:hypothetical protein